MEIMLCQKIVEVYSRCERTSDLYDNVPMTPD